MDTTKRTFAKAVTWQAMGFVAMSLVAYLFTGSLTASSGIAVSGMMLGFGTYFAHEKVWGLISWGRR